MGKLKPFVSAWRKQHERLRADPGYLGNTAVRSDVDIHYGECMVMHTKGPWKAKGKNNRYGSIGGWEVNNDDLDVLAYAPINANGKQIAIVLSDQEDQTEMDANAALIAAAPDLLEALKGVLRVADRATVEFDAARAAIAKAEGK